MTRAVRVGLVGAGKNARRRHVPGLARLPAVEIVAVCNRSRESSQRFADEFGVPKVYDDWHGLIEDPDLNAVVIGTWPDSHADVACAALDAGKHVLCEARMAMDAPEARRMLERSRAYPELVAQLVPAPFTLSVDATILGLIADGFLGERFSIVIEGGSRAFADPRAPLGWRHQRSLSGYNVLNLGIWYECSLRWWGPAARVVARSRTFVNARHDPATGGVVEVGVPDHVDVLAEYADGALGSFRFSSVSGLGPAPGAWLFGSTGTLHYDQETDRLFGGKPGDDALGEIVVPAEKRGRWRVEEEFVNAIRGHEETALTRFEDGVRYMDFTEAVHRSAGTGDPVALPLDG